MSAATLCRMAKPKDEPTEQVRLPKSIVRRLRRLASHLDRSEKSVIMEVLESHLRKLEVQMLADLQQEQGGDRTRRK
jgi:predicted DNA-binding protein